MRNGLIAVRRPPVVCRRRRRSVASDARQWWWRPRRLWRRGWWWWRWWRHHCDRVHRIRRVPSYTAEDAAFILCPACAEWARVSSRRTSRLALVRWRRPGLSGRTGRSRGREPCGGVSPGSVKWGGGLAGAASAPAASTDTGRRFCHLCQTRTGPAAGSTALFSSTSKHPAGGCEVPSQPAGS